MSVRLLLNDERFAEFIIQLANNSFKTTGENSVLLSHIAECFRRDCVDFGCDGDRPAQIEDLIEFAEKRLKKHRGF